MLYKVSDLLTYRLTGLILEVLVDLKISQQIFYFHSLPLHMTPVLWKDVLDLQKPLKIQR